MIRMFRQIFKSGIVTEDIKPAENADISAIGEDLRRIIKKRFKGSLAIRQIDAGSCNGCEFEINAMGNVFYDAERYGIHFTASPRFADMLLVTGPVSVNMELALKRTIESTPTPRIVVAVGDCGADGGVFGKTYASRGGVADVVHVDAVIPGCPPTPEQMLGGILRILKGEDPEKKTNKR